MLVLEDFEPLTIEDVMHIVDLEQPKGVVVQFGGQTAINLADQLEARGVQILGTSLDDIDRAESWRAQANIGTVQVIRGQDSDGEPLQSRRQRDSAQG